MAGTLTVDFVMFGIYHSAIRPVRSARFVLSIWFPYSLTLSYARVRLDHHPSQPL
jgi:hypothetical protein